MRRLNLGCGRTPTTGYINCDLYPYPGVQVVMDAAKQWPFKDNIADTICAIHLIEHLPEPLTFMREAWRALTPNSKLFMRLPWGISENGMGDVTHLRYYMLSSFLCFQPDYIETSGNLAYAQRDYNYRVQSIHLRVNAALRWLVKPWIRRWGLKLLPYLVGGFTEMIIQMNALKTTYDIEECRKTLRREVTPYCRVIYKHEYEGRRLKPDEQLEWMYF